MGKVSFYLWPLTSNLPQTNQQTNNFFSEDPPYSRGNICLCVTSLRDLLIHQFVDMISINIHSNRNDRYLIEFHPIEDPCLRAIHDNMKDLIRHLDQIFAQTIRSIQQIKPLSNFPEKFSKKRTFQMRFNNFYFSSQSNFLFLFFLLLSRLTSKSKTRKLGEIFKEKSIYKELLLINE
uniref:Uncharacterized protein n=1 Tax=Philodina roseola TaxID=96448 RepID=B3G4P3_PHIRO|nr:unknown [Philodina roseola]